MKRFNVEVRGLAPEDDRKIKEALDAEKYILVCLGCGSTYPVEDKEELQTCFRCKAAPCIEGSDLCEECFMDFPI